MTMVRDAKCMDCGHDWINRVVMSENTQNISGERTVYCPQCGGRNTVAHPMYRYEDKDPPMRLGED